MFKDLLLRESEEGTKNLSFKVFSEYSQLPGIIADRFFSIVDKNGDKKVSEQEFVTAFKQLYLSDLQMKMKISFEIFDFDKDGFISREDIRLIMSFVPF